MNESLRINAKTALRDVAPSLWDSYGLAHFKTLCTHIEASEDDLLTVWKGVIADAEKSRSRRSRQYADAGGLFSSLTPESRAKEKEESYVTDIASWSDVKIKRVEKINSCYRFILEDNVTFDMDAGDVYSQMAFKKAFSRTACSFLPPISESNYLRFITSFKPSLVTQTGVAREDIIEGLIEDICERYKTMETETEDAAITAAMYQQYGFFDQTLYFKITTLHYDIKRTLVGISHETLVGTLRGLGADVVSLGRKAVWKWRSDVEYDNPEISV